MFDPSCILLKNGSDKYISAGTGTSLVESSGTKQGWRELQVRLTNSVENREYASSCKLLTLIQTSLL